jgi:ABC-2 type transport system permease protein
MGMRTELIRKDLRIFVADRRGVITTIMVPIALASLMAMLYGGMSGGSGKGQKPRPVPLAVADQDGSDISKALIEDLRKQGLVTPSVMSRSDAEAAVRGGKFSSALILPEGFGNDAPNAMFSGRNKPQLELIYDPSKSVEMQVVQGALMR